MRKKVFQGLLTAAIGLAFVIQGGCGGGAKQPSLPTAPTATSQASSPQLTITVVTLPDAALGSTYASALHADGGSAPYTWKLAQGSLPDGLTLTQDGALTGVPAAAGIFQPTVQVSDTAHTSVTRMIELHVAPLPIVINETQLPFGYLGASYSATTLSANGGFAPLSWSVAGGQLPPGLALANSGQVTGVPAAAGSFVFTVRATDSYSPPLTTTGSFKITVGDGKSPTISNITVNPLSSTSARVDWSTDLPSDSFVAWSNDSGAVWDSGTLDPAGVTTHSVTLTGMRPGTYNGEFNTIRSRPVSDGVADAGKAAFATLPAVTTLTAAQNGGAFSDYNIEYIGPHRVVGGNALYLSLHSYATNLPAGRSFTYVNTTITGVPPNATVTVISSGGASSWSSDKNVFRRYQDNTQYADMVRLDTTSSTAPGTYTLHFTSVDEDTPAITRNMDWTVTVDPAATFSMTQPVTNPPPIPCLRRTSTQMNGAGCSYNWEDNMVRDGKKWCMQAGSTGVYSGVWFYDGERVYFRVKDYDGLYGLTGNASQWDACTQQQESVYRPYALGPGISGYTVFPHGLYEDWVRNSDDMSKSAVANLALKGYFNATFGLPDTNLARENAYRIHAELFYAKLRATDPTMADRTRYLKDNVEIALGRVDQWTSGNMYWMQPFMVGLWAESLIECYEDSLCPEYHDARIPIAIKTMADHLWTTAWVTGDKNCGPAGSYYNDKSDYGCFYYNSYSLSIGVAPYSAGSDARNLNLLIVPMWGWLYKMTGDATYQAQGDTIWQSGVNGYDGAGSGWSGKNFSQQYRWSFDYVNWRSKP